MTRIQTERLLLRPLGAGDLDDFAELQGQPEVARFMVSCTREEVVKRLAANEAEWEERGHGMLAVLERRTGRFLGRTGLKYWPEFDEVEAGWALRVQEWGQGYATEAAQAVVEWGLVNLPLDYITAMIVPSNERSLRVARRVGFEPLRDEIVSGHQVIVHARRRPGAAS